MSLIARIAQQRLERAEAEHVVEHLGEERLALAEVERRRLFREQLAEQRANLAFGAAAIGLRQRLEVQPVEQLAVDVRPQLEVLLARRRPAASRPSPADVGLWTRSLAAARGEHGPWSVTRSTRGARGRAC